MDAVIPKISIKTIANAFVDLACIVMRIQNNH